MRQLNETKYIVSGYPLSKENVYIDDNYGQAIKYEAGCGASARAFCNVNRK